MISPKFWKRAQPNNSGQDTTQCQKQQNGTKIQSYYRANHSFQDFTDQQLHKTKFLDNKTKIFIMHLFTGDKNLWEKSELFPLQVKE